MPCPEESLGWLTLAQIPGLGCTIGNRLVAAMGSPEQILQGLDVKLLATVPGMGTATRLGDASSPDGPGRSRRSGDNGPNLAILLADPAVLARARRQAEAICSTLAKTDIHLLTPNDPLYPRALTELPDRPMVLYCRGALQVCAQPSLAIVGSRAASDYGRRVAAMLAMELAAAGVHIVSGAASGIDAAAHHGALQVLGSTTAVLGCGLDVVYPRNHGPLLREIAERGLLLSEYPLGAAPESFHFPVRNRIISGLAQGVLVVEATERSGSLITARLALEQGREIFAVPGRIDSAKSVGPHRLIQQGAMLVQRAEDILETLALCWELVPQQDASMPQAALALSPEEEALLNDLDVYPRDIDTLIQITNLPAAKIQGLLLQLELKGLVRALPGQLYERSRDPSGDKP